MVGELATGGLRNPPVADSMHPFLHPCLEQRIIGNLSNRLRKYRLIHRLIYRLLHRLIRHLYTTNTAGPPHATTFTAGNHGNQFVSVSPANSESSVVSNPLESVDTDSLRAFQRDRKVGLQDVDEIILPPRTALGDVCAEVNVLYGGNEK